jgi:hypothetical protein
MSLSREFTMHYLSIDPETSEAETNPEGFSEEEAPGQTRPSRAVVKTDEPFRRTGNWLQRDLEAR